jgi:flagellar hook assembly protein FlgD
MIVASSSEQISVSTPSMFALESAYPNPFNPSTSLRLYIPMESSVNVSVYNLMGQQVDVIHDGLLSSGYTNLTWNASDFPSGMYIVRATSNTYTTSQKIMLLK